VELSGTPLASSVSRGRSLGTHLLEVRDLEIRISIDSGHQISALEGVSFDVAAGEVVGLLGESGAGKSTLALALLRLLPSSFRVTGGSIQFEARPLLSLSERELRKIRGASISLIYQDSTVLNPVMRTGDQILEVLRAHRDWNSQRCREEARLLLEEVELEDIDRVNTSYPHQLSGGQRQRIVIAQALACRPALVIADEPTSSLDPTTAASLVELLRRLNRQFKIAFLVISHDIKILARLADRVMVMYAGRIVEQGPCQTILHEPLHPYTRALLSCALPEEGESRPGTAKSSLPTIAGRVVESQRTSLHCNFESRCADRMRICAMSLPNEVETAKAHTVSCFKFGKS
jgi:peptide/nickel transport system ATP-binding protein